MAGFNSSRFDVPMLAEEFLRAGVEFDISKREFVDVQIIFHKKNSVPWKQPIDFIATKNWIKRIRQKQMLWQRMKC